MATKKKPDLTAAARSAFTAIRADAPQDHFYFFALYTTEDGSYVGATAWSEEALTRVVARASSAKGNTRSVEELARDLRFSAPDSPFHDTHDEVFAGFEPGKKLHDACFDAMRELDFEGFFGKGAARSKVIMNVVYGDMSDERWLAHADRLNSRAAIARVLPFLRLHLPSGNVEAWGAKAYQVNALSLSRSRALVAYSGSGGEVGILEFERRIPIIELKRRGEHWACAIDEDTRRLFLGDADGIIDLDLDAPKSPIAFAKTAKPSYLALSGKHLAASSWDAPLRVYDTTSKKKVWEDKSFKKASLAFSPDGASLAVADEGKVSCFDAATGKLRWSSRLAARCGLAWNGEELVAGATVLDAARGKRLRVLPFTSSIEAVAVSPSGSRIAFASGKSLVVVDRDGREVTRATGTQEQLIACVFPQEDAVLAAGRDVNRGPALLTLRVGRA